MEKPDIKISFFDNDVLARDKIRTNLQNIGYFNIEEYLNVATLINSIYTNSGCDLVILGDQIPQDIKYSKVYEQIRQAPNGNHIKIIRILSNNNYTDGRDDAGADDCIDRKILTDPTPKEMKDLDESIKKALENHKLNQ